MVDMMPLHYVSISGEDSGQGDCNGCHAQAPLTSALSGYARRLSSDFPQGYPHTSPERPDFVQNSRLSSRTANVV